MASDMKVFYSWQSDLPNNATRSFIQECIEAAVKHLSGIITVEADRDTKGTFGSPDIVQTIFSKIDECDLFIADVSIVNKYNAVDDNGEKSETIKLSPNPNVLLELGYAAKTLTWDNVLCIMNTDYGEVGELPFDLEHRRPLQYSLKGKTRSAVNEQVRNVIVANILNVMEKGVKNKGNVPNHMVGSFDFNSNNLCSDIKPYNIQQSEYYVETFTDLKNKIKVLVDKIDNNKLIKTPEKTEEKTESSKESALAALTKSLSFYTEQGKPASINDEDIVWIKEQVFNLYGLTLDEDFFCLGNLKINIGNFYVKTEYVGTKEEKQKLNDIRELQSKLLDLYLLETFVKTFDEILMFPLAIYNNSSTADEDISVTITINPEEADIVTPSKCLLAEELRGDDEHIGLEGAVFDSGYIKMLMMSQSSQISYDTDISYDHKDLQRDLRRNAIDVLGNSTYEPDEEDYEDEIKKFIATPINEKSNSYLFEIDSLRANEKKWLGPMIAIKPKQEEISLTYSIKSKYSDGQIASVIEYKA